MAAQRRFYVTWMGDFYQDALNVEANLKNRTVASEAASLLGAKLMERSEKRREMVQYLADKYNCSFEEMWKQLAEGSFKPSESDQLPEE